jgi:threonylcarbamoyladenosine tRNA methylthiotransferase MtaB
MRFSINTLGCKVNLCESDAIAGLLMQNGLQMVDYRSGNPHICIINTCTVTAESDRKVRQLIRKIKNANSRAILAVTGCYVRDHRDFLIKSGVDLIIGNEEKKDISLATARILETAGNTGNIAGDRAGYGPGRKNPHSRPIVKIQDGCEQNCAYCIIPRVRGGYRSTPADRIVESIDMLSEQGYAEAVLTGIHAGKYGVDTADGTGLAGLLEKIFSETGIERIRISSLEINDICENLLGVMEKYRERMASHLHIPLQSGSDAILKSMGRPYDSGFFRRSAENIYQRLPGFTITTDIMTGFPGETTGDLEKTLELVRQLRFSKLHVFRYSPRPGTRAWLLGDSVPPQEKSRRSRMIRSIGEELRQVFLNANTGLVMDVAAESGQGAGGMVSGTSGNYIKVYFKPRAGLEDIRGRIINIRTQKKYRQGLMGEEAP